MQGRKTQPWESNYFNLITSQAKLKKYDFI